MTYERKRPRANATEIRTVFLDWASPGQPPARVTVCPVCQGYTLVFADPGKVSEWEAGTPPGELWPYQDRREIEALTTGRHYLCDVRLRWSFRKSAWDADQDFFRGASPDDPDLARKLENGFSAVLHTLNFPDDYVPATRLILNELHRLGLLNIGEAE